MRLEFPTEDDGEPVIEFNIFSSKHWAFVAAGPKSAVTLRVLKRTARVDVWHPTAPDGSERAIEVKVELRLREVPNMSYGPYDLASIHLSDSDGRGITPELMRSLPVSEYIAAAAMGGAAAVVIIDADGTMTEHASPEKTLPQDDLIVATWLRARVARVDANEEIRKLLPGSSRGAVAQRISRLRAAGKLPPARGKGARR